MKRALIFAIVSLLLAGAFLPYSLESSDLTIICSSKVEESYPFVVTIKSNNTTIANATVTFNGEENKTNNQGKVIFYAPRVLPNENNTYTITAIKEGYNSTTISIEIVNVPQLFPTVINSNIEEHLVKANYLFKF